MRHLALITVKSVSFKSFDLQTPQGMHNCSTSVTAHSWSQLEHIIVIPNAARYFIVDRPAAMVDQPAAVVDRPAAVVDRPAAMADRPAAVVDQPAAVVDQPAAKVNRPAAKVVQLICLLHWTNQASLSK